MRGNPHENGMGGPLDGRRYLRHFFYTCQNGISSIFTLKKHISEYHHILSIYIIYIYIYIHIYIHIHIYVISEYMIIYVHIMNLWCSKNLCFALALNATSATTTRPFGPPPGSWVALSRRSARPGPPWSSSERLGVVCDSIPLTIDISPTSGYYRWYIFIIAIVIMT